MAGIHVPAALGTVGNNKNSCAPLPADPSPDDTLGTGTDLHGKPAGIYTLVPPIKTLSLFPNGHKEPLPPLGSKPGGNFFERIFIITFAQVGHR